MKVSQDWKTAVLSTDTFTNGGELSAIRKWAFRAKRSGIERIKKIEVRLDNRSGGVSRFRLDISGEYVEPVRYPWHICYSRMWEVRHYGIGKGHKKGVFGQFPDVDFETEDACVMEQIWAGEIGFVRHPEPGFKNRHQIVRLKPSPSVERA